MAADHERPQDAPWDQAFFHAEVKATSRIKHMVLEAYIEKFAYHMPTLLYCVDGFAGAGVYGVGGGAAQAGSPVLIAQVGQRMQVAKPGFHLRCINVEKTPSTYAQLERVTAPFRPHIVEINFQGPFIDFLVDILERIKDAPTFFFIDPFGAKDIAWAPLRPIVTRTFTTEVLVNLQTAGIAKKAGYFAWVDSPLARRHNIGMKTTQNLAAALGVEWEQLRSWWQEGQDVLKDTIVTHYRRRLRASDTAFQYTKAFPVYYPRPGVPPDVGDAVCFYLVFATQSRKGLYVMNDCMAQAVDRFVDQEYADSFFPILRRSIDLPARLQELEREILTRFRTRSFTIEAVKDEVMQETGLLVRTPEYRKAVLRLRGAGKLTQLDKGQVVDDRTRFKVAA